MPCNPAHSELFAHRFELPVKEIPPAERSPLARPKNQGVGIEHGRLTLDENIDSCPSQRNQPVALLGLWFIKHAIVYGLSNAKRTTLEIDIPPAKREDFPNAHPR